MSASALATGRAGALTFTTSGRRAAAGIITTATTAATTTSSTAAAATLTALATFAFLRTLSITLRRCGSFRTRSFLARLRGCLLRLLLTSLLLRAAALVATTFGRMLFARLALLSLLAVRVATRFLLRRLIPALFATATATITVTIS